MRRWKGWCAFKLLVLGWKYHFFWSTVLIEGKSSEKPGIWLQINTYYILFGDGHPFASYFDVHRELHIHLGTCDAIPPHPRWAWQSWSIWRPGWRWARRRASRSRSDLLVMWAGWTWLGCRRIFLGKTPDPQNMWPQSLFLDYWFNLPRQHMWGSVELFPAGPHS